MIKFGLRLQEAIKQSGMSQSELGRRLGTTSQSVNGWCQSGVIPRKDVLEKIPKITGKPLYWFFMSDNEINNVFVFPEGKNNSQLRCVELMLIFAKLSESDQNIFLQQMHSILKHD